jgi:hypothetical protein
MLTGTAGRTAGTAGVLGTTTAAAVPGDGTGIGAATGTGSRARTGTRSAAAATARPETMTDRTAPSTRSRETRKRRRLASGATTQTPGPTTLAHPTTSTPTGVEPGPSQTEALQGRPYTSRGVLAGHPCVCARDWPHAGAGGSTNHTHQYSTAGGHLQQVQQGSHEAATSPLRDGRSPVEGSVETMFLEAGTV